MIVNLIIAFLVAIGTMGLVLAVLSEKRKSSYLIKHTEYIEDNEKQNISDDIAAQFRKCLDEDAPGLLQHLTYYHSKFGVTGVKQLAESYTSKEVSSIRSHVLQVFMKLYTTHNPDEELLNDILQNIKDIKANGSEELKRLIGDIGLSSPFQVRILSLLSELFEITEFKVTRFKEKFGKITASLQDIISVSPIQQTECQMKEIVISIDYLIKQLSQSMFNKEVKDKKIRWQKLETSLDCIQEWINSSVIFHRDDITILTEGILARKFIQELWQKINIFLHKTGGKPKKINNIDLKLLNTDVSEPLKFSKTAIVAICISVLFYLMAIGTWYRYYIYPKRFNISKAIENIVQIKTPTGQGTGFFIRQDKLIISNFHVIKPYTEVTVFLKTRGKPESPIRTAPAVVLVYDDSEDIVILELKNPESTNDLPIGFDIATTAVFTIGQNVHVLGNPVGITDVYSKGTVMKVKDDTAFLDVKVAPGNSGGPVCDDQGVVIGITTAYAKSGEGGFDFGIAIPSYKAYRLLNRESILLLREKVIRKHKEFTAE